MVAVIILNWNGAKLLEEFLPSVISNTNPLLAKVIVADNGSTDNSIAIMEEKFPEVELWKFDRNYGFAAGYNKAIELAKDYEYCVLLNSDAAPAPRWIEPLLEKMQQDSQIGAAQPKLLSYKNPDTFEYAGGCGGFLDKNGYPYCRGRIFGDCEKDENQYQETTAIFWATGAAFMVRTQVYLQAGGLDPEFFAHMEEIDLCWRIQLLGYKIVCIPQSVVYHLGGGSLPAENPRKTFLNFRNNLLMLHKNLPDNVRNGLLIRRRLLDTIAWAKYMATFDFKNAAAIWRAHREFAKMRENYKDHPDQNLLPNSLYSRVNILIEYYLKRKKKFSDIFKKEDSHLKHQQKI